MAKWRPIDTRLWTDRKFMTLADDGKLLWLWLLTSPFGTPIPGVIVSGEMAIAESIGWTIERYRKGYRELLAKGLSIRMDGRLIWLFKALEYQKVCGPKHIVSMAKTWDDVPDVELKSQVWEALKISCKSWPKLFADGFPKPEVDHPINGIGRGIVYPKAYSNTQDTDQDQDQKTDQDQEQDITASPKPTKRRYSVPDDWKPERSTANLDAEQAARARGVDLGLELSKLHDWAKSNNAKKADWDSTWRNWTRNAKPSGSQRSQQTGFDVAMGIARGEQ